jgi:hypothetical protein
MAQGVILMFRFLRKGKEGKDRKGQKKNKKSTTNSKQQTAAAAPGGVVQRSPPVATKRRPKTEGNIKTSDVEKIWTKKKQTKE